jgi:SsrA-binding protein
MHIAPYKPARENHEPERPRKLLLHRREIERLLGATSEKGLTIVPTRLYWSGARAKVELAVAKGKDLYDKRRSIKERDTRREIERAMSERY